MNLNHIINIIIRQVMGQLINRGVRAGFDKAGKMADQRKAARGEPVPDPSEMTPQQRRQRRRERQQAREMRQKMNAGRKIGRF